MKLTGITGTGTGKLGSSVFAVNSGVQIVRQYQPVVANPSTEGQVEQRAKLKLASQLARDLKASIVIPKEGLVTARNKFMSKNFDLISYEDNTASADVAGLQLTAGTAYLPAVSQAQSIAQTGSLRLTFVDTLPEFDYMHVVVAQRNLDGSLSLKINEDVKKADITIDPETNEAEFEFAGAHPDTNDIVLAYAFSFATSDARVRYSEMAVEQGASIADVVATRSEIAANTIFTRTSGAKITI